MAADRTEEAFGFELMRSCLLAVLRGTDETRLDHLNPEVMGEAIKRTLLLPNPQELGTQHLPPSKRGLLREAIWAFIIEGILIPGSSTHGDIWPHFTVTEYGKRCVARQEVLPHDPSGYLESLGQLDAVEDRFIPQALEAFLRNVPDASAVMLGCASEHLILKLGEALVASDPASEALTQTKLDESALKLLNHIITRFDALNGKKSTDRRKLPPKLAELRTTHFASVGQVIRVTRNDAGHPARSAPVSREDCFMLLLAFKTYREWIKDVIDHLGQTSVPTT